MKNLTYINVIILLVMSMWANTALAIPSITATASAGTTIKFTATLSEKLLSGYKVKIDYGNGKGLVAMTCSSTTCSLSSNSLPVGVNSASYKIGIYNAKGILQGATTDGTYVIISPLTTGYSKISNTGAVLPDNAVLGTGTNDWACTKDNKTGLIWEIKTTDSGIRDMSQKYTNWITGDIGYGQTSNSDYFASAVNKLNLCGANDWRLPTNEELKGLVFCSDGQYSVLNKDIGGNICINNTTLAQPTINTTYFPNTQTFAFWSSSIFDGIANSAWYINFYGGSQYAYDKGEKYYIRLVHTDKLAQSNTSENTAVDYLNTQKAAADKTIAEYLISVKSTADKAVADYLTGQKAAADATAAEYLVKLKATADVTAAEYLAKLKNTTDTSTTTISSTSSSVYVKISNGGATLADSAKLGTGANDWACTKDKKTGLIWEVKTTNDDLRDTIKSYTITGALELISAVNSKSLCGSTNWRLPTNIELKLLLSTSKNEPYIDNQYFPNTQSLVYWTSTHYYSDSNYIINFGSKNFNFYADNNNYYNVRLVHQ